MEEHVQLLVSIAALLASALAIIAVWRKSGAIEGKILERLENQQEWLRGHEQRLQSVEQAKFLTEDAHEKASNKCTYEIHRRLDDSHTDLANLKQAVSHTRETDNERWCRIEVTLGKIEEFIKSLKSAEV